ncbi:hypothetical protein ABN028_16125 [Actinopolymorpha sp. B17G11]|uniref:GNAT family N-acetyltransferase n=1 Tax=unclassified Actinopolymorpha TaxID=2627063 RepID=UPI0032D94A2B
MTENQVVETDRLLIKGYRADDVEPLLAYYSIPAVARHLIHGPRDRARAEEQVGRTQRCISAAV